MVTTKEYGRSSIIKRVNGERSYICIPCKSYRRCALRKIYCSPYYLATLKFYNAPHTVGTYLGLHIKLSRYVYHPFEIKGDYRTYWKEVVEPEFKNGFKIEDFCKNCEVKKREFRGHKYNCKGHCSALRVVKQFVECPSNKVETGTTSGTYFKEMERVINSEGH